MTDSTRERAPADQDKGEPEPEKLASPLMPLLWLLIPFLGLILWGLFGG